MLLVIPYAAAMLLSQPSRYIYRENVFACVIRTKESITRGSQSPPSPAAPRLAAWTVVCLSTHTSRVGKHGTQSACLRGKKLTVPEMWLKKRWNKKVTNKRCNLVTLQNGQIQFCWRSEPSTGIFTRSSSTGPSFHHNSRTKLRQCRKANFSSYLGHSVFEPRTEERLLRISFFV